METISPFEHISVLVSIILGLGITQSQRESPPHQVCGGLRAMGGEGFEPPTPCV